MPTWCVLSISLHTTLSLGQHRNYQWDPAIASSQRFILCLTLYCKYFYSLTDRRFTRFDIISQLPSNIFLRYLGVRNWLAFCVIAWGAVQLAMGFVPTWTLLAVCRALLGAFEVKTIASYL
jgi:hypothetical protein